MDERQPSILSKGQREFLSVGGEKKSDAAARMARKRLRERVFAGLNDGTLLWQFLSTDDRDQIFNMWREDEYVGQDYEFLSEGDRRRSSRFRHALTCWLATIYAGVQRNQDLGFDFEDILADAVASAVHARGGLVEQFEFSVDVRDSFDTEALLRKFENRDPKLQMQEVQHLREEGEVTSEDVAEYREDIRPDRRRPIGNVSEDDDTVRDLFAEDGDDNSAE